MSADQNLVGELMNIAKIGPSARRAEILSHVTDLFVLEGSRLSEDEIALFDDVILRLTVEIETRARALLSMRLAPIPHAPPRTIHKLAFDDEIEVAGPVLSQSERLTEAALIESAKLKGQDHMLAISRRRTLGEAVTDILIERGDQQVLLSTAQNAGAKISVASFSRSCKSFGCRRGAHHLRRRTARHSTAGISATHRARQRNRSDEAKGLTSRPIRAH